VENFSEGLGVVRAGEKQLFRLELVGIGWDWFGLVRIGWEGGGYEERLKHKG
jgi:hypothetical protein